MSNWVTDDSLKSLNDSFTYKFEPHSPVKKNNITWPICRYCGLLYLKNSFTDWAVKKGCMNKYHPDKKRFLKSKC